MRVVVYPHDLDVGGSQLVAIEVAGAVRDLGHEVVVFGRAGQLNGRIDDLGLEFVPAPPAGRRPSPATAAALRELVGRRRIDVVHGYEWPPVLDAALAQAGRPRTAAVVATVMSMSVPSFIPRSIPLVVGTQEIAEAERRAGRGRVHVLEPPVDLVHNDVGRDPGAAAFRSRFGVEDGALTVVSVCRFARELKLEGLLTAMDVVGRMSRSHRVKLILVGDGPAWPEVAARADIVNAEYGAGTVVLTGRLDDPRPAYAAADIALGMGGSALRALAYGLPLVVQGEQGFWRTLTPQTLDTFLWTGWYGSGAGAAQGADTLRGELQSLVSSPDVRAKLGAFGLSVVREQFSLERAGALQSAVYEDAVRNPSALASVPLLTATARYGAYYAAKRIRRARGTEREDDFNARPVAALRRARRP